MLERAEHRDTLIWCRHEPPRDARRSPVGGPGGLRRGVLEILVDNAVLLQELAHYQKRRLLEKIRQRLPGMPINDLRFRAGVWNQETQR